MTVGAAGLQRDVQRLHDHRRPREVVLLRDGVELRVRLAHLPNEQKGADADILRAQGSPLKDVFLKDMQAVRNLNYK